ncbi:unnamed protein product [Rotaria sp. Silwood2]|nr:unnamed protein product [Rotaria sp. Silwood2]CAF2919639.1 unnamed protein product [Rotaria sp. Silwood2]CAF3154450.1 unnamed protein product [Rotaria sp. Silwood2]CAF3272889.1 unnamed protein product [Rotaria sp. Silwood2]CAF4088413.1 unnamed protein product [Rotaria sp. Silwood2]
MNNENKSTATTNQNDKNNQDFKYSLSLSYVPDLEVLKRKLETDLKIELYFSYSAKIQSYFNRTLKPPSKPVIYQIPCSCEKAYVGQTKVGAENRMKQHFKLISNDEDTKSDMVQYYQATK